MCRIVTFVSPYVSIRSMHALNVTPTMSSVVYCDGPTSVRLSVRWQLYLKCDEGMADKRYMVLSRCILGIHLSTFVSPKYTFVKFRSLLFFEIKTYLTNGNGPLNLARPSRVKLERHLK